MGIVKAVVSSKFMFGYSCSDAKFIHFSTFLFFHNIIKYYQSCIENLILHILISSYAKHLLSNYFLIYQYNLNLFLLVQINLDVEGLLSLNLLAQ